MLNATKIMAIQVKRFKSLDSAETLVLHSCLGKTKVVAALNITFETKVYKAVVN